MKLKRYDVKTFDNYQESESGFWVRFQDVQQLQSQLTTLREANEKIRLEKDALIDNCLDYEFKLRKTRSLLQQYAHYSNEKAMERDIRLNGDAVGEIKFNSPITTPEGD